MSILEFRNSILKSYFDIDAVKTGRPKKNPAPRGEHYLKVKLGAARLTRKRCVSCYHALSQESGREVAQMKAPKVKTYCPDCENQPHLCVDCYKKVHKH